VVGNSAAGIYRKLEQVLMTRATRTFYALSIAAFCLILSSLAPPARAATIGYSNSPFLPPGVQFVGVKETSITDPLPMFGTPSYFTTGIDTNPSSFAASSGGSSPADTTDGIFEFDVVDVITIGEVDVIKSISVGEAGDYSLSGFGTAATTASANLTLEASVIRIDGVGVAPIVLTPVNSLGAFNLLANAGVVQPWQLSGTLDVEGSLTALNIPFQYGATGVRVKITNSLQAASEAASVSLIQKKEFIVSVEAESIDVPEPATSALGAAALCGLAAVAGRRRSGN
jgi:hypothetical protein